MIGKSAGDVALAAAAIGGEKWQLTSELVSIDVRQIALRGGTGLLKHRRDHRIKLWIQRFDAVNHHIDQFQ